MALGIGSLMKIARGSVGTEDMGEMLSAAGIDISFNPVAIEKTAFEELAKAAMVPGATHLAGIARISALDVRLEVDARRAKLCLLDTNDAANLPETAREKERVSIQETVSFCSESFPFVNPTRLFRSWLLAFAEAARNVPVL